MDFVGIGKIKGKNCFGGEKISKIMDFIMNYILLGQICSRIVLKVRYRGKRWINLEKNNFILSSR